MSVAKTGLISDTGRLNMQFATSATPSVQQSHSGRREASLREIIRPHHDESLHCPFEASPLARDTLLATARAPDQTKMRRDGFGSTKMLLL
ncbi:hypothetical protein PDE_01311 [Penicillium oxalicum 114-2]|uniref:Uncharacterized protein n=1 Tax=Penicillium oxalicum (strain 114-2 / CGMCC 5302) TaxID=933388 RepID=S7Z764_PENO1|nr:hypothetical protein PDE_01311 [Penicillium oxalicum 114-2]